jgi:hypothetical protein
VRKGGLDASGSGQGPVADCYEHGNEPSDSIRGGKFLDLLLKVKVKVKLSLCFEHHAIKAYWGSGG